MDVLAGKRDLYPEMAAPRACCWDEDTDTSRTLLRLAELRETRLGDEEGARAAIKEVQSLAPGTPMHCAPWYDSHAVQMT